MERKVRCHVFPCLGSLSALTSSPPPFFFIKRSTRCVGGLASIAAEMALVIAVTSVAVVGAVAVWGDTLGSGIRNQILFKVVQAEHGPVLCRVVPPVLPESFG